MSGDISPELRRFAGRAIEAFIQAVERQYNGQAANADMLRGTAAAFALSPLLGDLAEAAARDLGAAGTEDPFQHLLAWPLAELLESGQLGRERLPNYFHFIHLIMGDGQVPLAEAATAIYEHMRAQPFPPFTWEAFLADERIRIVLWTVLLRIAESFKRYEIRRDWFITLMENDSHSISLGPNAFVPRPRGEVEEGRTPFNRDSFLKLFAALFAPLRRLPAQEAAVFKKAFQHTPEQAFGPLWLHLLEDGAKL
ncbi:hypothetical protein GALL_79730 [mine drainage metagenome]|uniref:Uncharacterized protein n=1 Tax=mine drainage metagenome TaxID=410659 RepID=A0A1J5TD58_9ZZZZ